MFKKAKLVFNIVSLVLIAIVLTTLGYSWFTVPRNSIDTSVTGKLVQEYFHCGSGKEDDPFVITRPVHYYHLVEFYQRTSNLPVVYNEDDTVVQFGNELLYFQIGCPEEQLYNPSLRPEVDDDTEFYVFDYTNWGQVNKTTNANGDKTQVLNMAYYSAENSLLPVGSSEVPFYGVIEGNNITIQNLSIVASEDVVIDVDGVSTTVTRQTSDLGAFGFIYGGTIINNLYIDSMTITLNGATTDATINTSVTNYEHTASHEEDVYVGLIAGHIQIGASFNNVYVNNSSIIGGAAATCNFGYFGLVDNNDDTTVSTLGEEVAKLRGAGDESGFGGSMDMLSLHTRLKAMSDEAGTNAYYVSSEEIGIDEASGDKWVIDQTLTKAGKNNNNSYHYYDSSTTGGQANLLPYNSGQYMCLYGESIKYPKTVYTYTYKDEYVNGFILSIDDNYLGIDEGALFNFDAEDAAQVWALDNNNHLYTYYAPSGVDNSCVYYLNRNGEINLSLSQTASTTWTIDGDNIYTTSNGKKYYIICDDEWVANNYGWGVTLESSFFKISDGTNYLNTNGSAITTSTSEASATIWAFDGTSGVIYTYVDGNIYYLYGTNGLHLDSTNQTTWSYDSTTGELSYVYNNQTFYLMFDNSWTVSTSVESYTICDSDGHYLNANGITNVSVGTSSNATKWFYNGEDGNICVNINNVIYYLDKDLTLTQTNPQIDWIFDDDSLKYVSNGNDIYLVYEAGAWYALQDKAIYTISNGNSAYLVLTTDGMINSSNDVEGSLAYYNGTNGIISFDYAAVTYYLNKNGIISQTSDNTSWVFNNNTLSYVYGGQTYYLIYNGKDWLVTKDLTTYSFRDANNHYLNLTTDGLAVGTSTDYTHWIYSNTNNGTLSTIINGVTYYLNAKGNISTTSDGTNWLFDANNRLYYNDGTNNQYIIYYENTFIVLPAYTIVKITDGTHYLNATTSGVTSGTSANSATEWLKTDDNKFFIESNGTYYYLTATKSGLSVSTTSMSFTYQNNDLSFVSSGVTYNVSHDGTNWIVYNPNISYYLIQDSRGNYMTGSGTTLGQTTTAASATVWMYNGTSDYISYDYNGTIYYLYASDTNDWKTLSLSASNKSTFTYSDGALKTSNKYVFYNNGSWVIHTSNGFYTIGKTSGGTTYYLNATSTSAFEAGTTQNTATLWKFSGTTSGTIDTGYNGAICYLRNQSNSLKVSTTSTDWTISSLGGNSTKIYSKSSSTGSNRYLRYSSGRFSISITSSNTVATTSVTITNTLTNKNYDSVNISLTNVNVNSTYTKTTINESNVVNITNKNPNYNIITSSDLLNVGMELSDIENRYAEITNGKQLQVITKSKETNVPSGNKTYVPLIADENSDDYAASSKNTGYIIGGAHLEEIGHIQSHMGDIRVSYYTISNHIENSYSTRTKAITKVYTYDGSLQDITNSTNYVAYEQAKENFLETLSKDSRYVYGLHFMNSAISMDHIIEANNVSIFGSTYDVYEFPEDSIDFYAVQRGQIAFFAGTYYSGNTAFFSLHQIFRDDDKKITDIKEIQYVYKHSTQGANSPYVYKYKDNTYGTVDASGKFVELGSLPSNYELAFNTDWLTNPGNFQDNYLYYFEIPCNQGEYALGSVDGEDGAYLCYLDIGTNGGAMLDSMISTEGTDLTNAFPTDFRSYPDTVNTSILQFSITSPADSTEETFKVTVEFDNSSDTCANTPYSNGLYTITVTNLTETNCEMLVLLCDDDGDFTTQFNYAYRIKYINSDNPDGEFIGPVEGIDYWQSANGYLIKPSGAAEQMNFN